MNREPPSSPPRYHPYRRKVEVFHPKNFRKHSAYATILLLTNVFVYLVATSPSSSSSSSSSKSKLPAISTSRLVQNVGLQAASDPNNNHFYHFPTVCADPIPPELVRETIIDRAFNGTSPWEKFPPPHVRPYLERGKIRGWGSHGAVFENMIRRVKPNIIIEIGTYLGASALHMVKLTHRLGLETHIICVDDFRPCPKILEEDNNIPMVNGDSVLLPQFMQNVIDAKATNSISFMPFSSDAVLEAFCQWGVYADLIEVDAFHYFHSAWNEINRGYKLLRPGGIMFGHDYFWHEDNKGVQRAVDLFARVNNLEVHIDGEHWFLLPPKAYE